MLLPQTSRILLTIVRLLFGHMMFKMFFHLCLHCQTISYIFKYLFCFILYSFHELKLHNLLIMISLLQLQQLLLLTPSLLCLLFVLN